MMGDEKDYYLGRAEDELQSAERAAHERAAWAHFQLAGRYFDLAYGEAREAAGDVPRIVAAPAQSINVSPDNLRMFAAQLSWISLDRERA